MDRVEGFVTVAFGCVWEVSRGIFEESNEKNGQRADEEKAR